MTTSPASVAGEIARVRALTAALVARDSWSGRRLLAHQRSELQDLVRHAVHGSRYYRETLGRDAGERRLSDLPTLSKAAMMDHFDDVVTDPRLRLADLEEHHAGPRASEPFAGEFRVFSTSGSSGLRGMFAFSLGEFATWTAAGLRSLGRVGIGPETRLVAIGAPDPMHITKQLFATFQSGRQTPALSVATPLDECVRALNDATPDALITYPSFCTLLAGEQRNGRLRIAPRLVLLGSELVTEDVRARVRDAWSVDVCEYYAATEAPALATASLGHRAMHILEDIVLLEVVDEHNRRLPPGVAGAKVLVTNLVNRAQPLIRYELSDAVTLAEGPSPVGLPCRRIARIEGRQADVLNLPGCRGGTVAVHPVRVGRPFARIPEVVQFQVTQRPDGLDVAVVVRRDDPRLLARIRDALDREIQEAGAAPTAIAVRGVDALEREPGPAGKLKLVRALAAAPQLG